MHWDEDDWTTFESHLPQSLLHWKAVRDQDDKMRSRSSSFQVRQMAFWGQEFRSSGARGVIKDGVNTGHVKYSMNSMTVNDGAAVEGAAVERPRKLLIVDHSSLESWSWHVMIVFQYSNSFSLSIYLLLTALITRWISVNWNLSAREQLVQERYLEFTYLALDYIRWVAGQSSNRPHG